MDQDESNTHTNVRYDTNGKPSYVSYRIVRIVSYRIVSYRIDSVTVYESISCIVLEIQRVRQSHIFPTPCIFGALVGVTTLEFIKLFGFRKLLLCAIVRRCLSDATFSRFYRSPICDGQTQTVRKTHIALLR